MREYRITLAEDDPDTLFLTQTMLVRAFPRSSISSFSNASDALRHILDSGTDILVTDHGMGSMTGADLIHELRERGLQIPIIMISGDPGAEQLAYLAGATRFLQKKGNANQLEQHIRRLLPQ